MMPVDIYIPTLDSNAKWPWLQLFTIFLILSDLVPDSDIFLVIVCQGRLAWFTAGGA